MKVTIEFDSADPADAAALARIFQPKTADTAIAEYKTTVFEPKVHEAVAMPPESKDETEDKPKRKRRTKAEMEADKAAAEKPKGDVTHDDLRSMAPKIGKAIGPEKVREIIASFCPDDVDRKGIGAIPDDRLADAKAALEKAAA